jgi:DNA-binding XRE family transcriptional regulator
MHQFMNKEVFIVNLIMENIELISSHEKLEYIGLLLREVRRQYGYTQEEVAEQVKSHRNSVSRIERGENFTMKLFLDIAQLYDFPISELFSDLE